jgi:hypothetical protein
MRKQCSVARWFKLQGVAKVAQVKRGNDQVFARCEVAIERAGHLHGCRQMNETIADVVGRAAKFSINCSGAPRLGVGDLEDVIQCFVASHDFDIAQWSSAFREPYALRAIKSNFCASRALIEKLVFPARRRARCASFDNRAFNPFDLPSYRR